MSHDPVSSDGDGKLDLTLTRGGTERESMTTEESSTPPMAQHIIQFFEYRHLPPELQEISKKFCDLAHELYLELDEGPEKTVVFRKLLESKDAAVRSHLLDLKNRARDSRIKEVKEILYPHSSPPFTTQEQ